MVKTENLSPRISKEKLKNIIEKNVSQNKFFDSMHFSEYIVTFSLMIKGWYQHSLYL